MYVLELGGQDDSFAVAEAQAAANGVSLFGSGLATADTIDSERIQHLAYTHRVSAVIGSSTGTVQAAVSLLRSHQISLDGPMAVRARNVRGTANIDTQLAERELGAILTQQGYTIDLDNPVNELRALFTDDVCILGWFHTASERNYGERMPSERPFFQPGSLDPLEARAIANLARTQPNSTIFDPMCGTGGLLIEAGLIGARVIGMDVQRKMVNGTRENLSRYLRDPGLVFRGDATSLPVCSDVDAVVLDFPYGRQSKVQGATLGDLITQVLIECSHISLRAVVISDHSLSDPVRHTPWRVESIFERRVHRSLTRYVHVLTNSSQ